MMQIELYNEIKAQPLDDDGDPVGQPVMLPAGKYRLISIFDKKDDGTASVWVEQLDQVYEAHGVRPT